MDYDQLLDTALGRMPAPRGSAKIKLRSIPDLAFFFGVTVMSMPRLATEMIYFDGNRRYGIMIPTFHVKVRFKGVFTNDFEWEPDWNSPGVRVIRKRDGAWFSAEDIMLAYHNDYAKRYFRLEEGSFKIVEGRFTMNNFSGSLIMTPTGHSITFNLLAKPYFSGPIHSIAAKGFSWTDDRFIPSYARRGKGPRKRLEPGFEWDSPHH